MDVFTQEWTFRSPTLTVTYPEGWEGTLPKDQQIAARKDRVLVPPSRTETADGNERPAKARAPRRARKAEG